MVGAATSAHSKPTTTFSANPCLISSNNERPFIQSCRPEGTFPARGSVWSQICPDGSFCQVSENIQQSVCCPKFGVDACLQSKASGIGTASLRRWYFDVISKQCNGFIFKGYQGNQNNFLTFEACRRQCQAINPCDYGIPYGFESVQGSQRCNPTTTSTCPPQYYCHSSSVDTVCCPLFNGTTFINNATNSQHISPIVGERQGSRKYISPCLLNILPGNGGMNLNRWAFNPSMNKCISFVYKGSGGNQNNFLTKNDCINTCIDTKEKIRRPKTINEDSEEEEEISPCLLALSTGRGTAILHRYYFDIFTSSCKAFTYTGIEYDNPCPISKPHTNAIDGRVTFCSTANPSCPKNHFCHIGDSRPTTVCCPSVGHACTSSLIIGIGEKQIPRYYYNSKSRTCVPFVYSGKG
uniref:BPTI/Kunitz inhibitor domain-containing protein n=1 Tax=Panagrolaimus superbus TaxID=310955 RepID=A0A914Z9D6_9BILA